MQGEQESRRHLGLLLSSGQELITNVGRPCASVQCASDFAYGTSGCATQSHSSCTTALQSYAWRARDDHVQVCMGFPDKGPDAPASAVFVGAEARLSPGGYVCPRWGRAARQPQLKDCSASTVPGGARLTRGCSVGAESLNNGVLSPETAVCCPLRQRCAVT